MSTDDTARQVAGLELAMLTDLVARGDWGAVMRLVLQMTGPVVDIAPDGREAVSPNLRRWRARAS